MADRVAGVLLHPTSLPGRFGIGELGGEAFAFLDFLEQAGLGLWQVLPLGPTGYGDSPYQCLSAFAGNPLLISPGRLCDEGLLSSESLERAPRLSEREVDFGAVIELKRRLFAEAFATFERTAAAAQRDALAAFARRNQHWLPDFALYSALKRAGSGAAWHAWERELATREKEALARARRDLARETREVEFEQWLFFSQWSALRASAHARGIRIMGDVPIFVAHDSSEVWSHPELFHLAADGSPSLQAGVPPDYFSATGQLWGNPLYRWDALARGGYRWWIERLRTLLGLVDLVRLDHFRGFEAFWEVAGDATTAAHGHWVKGPGAAFFEALQQALGPLPIVAEDLGLITEEVIALRERFRLPGMAVLQFAFGDEGSGDAAAAPVALSATTPPAGSAAGAQVASEAKGNPFLPHNLGKQTVAYTGTHDNDTIVGWWRGGVGDSTRSSRAVEREKRRALAYVGGDGREVHWDFIRALFVSVADTAIVPLQDVIGAGSEARMNLPGRADGNWRWRFAWRDLTPEVCARLRELAEVSGRARAVPRTG